MSYQIPQYKNSLKWISDGLSRSPGKKFLVALTGLFLIIFLLVHLAGNLLLLRDDGGFAFNSYARTMSELKIIRVMEVFLFGGFLLHIAYAVIVTIQNKRARGARYKSYRPDVTSSFFSRFMAPSGGMLFIFLTVHLNTFFVNHKLLDSGISMYDACLEAFRNPYVVILYGIAMILLSFHLMHGFQSAFQSLGIRHNKYAPLISMTGRLYAVGVPLMFALVPVYIFFKG